MATRTKPTTGKTRGATALKRSSEVATAKATDARAPGRTVGETGIENKSPQRTVKAAGAANAVAGQSLSEPKRAQPPAKPTSILSSPKPASRAPPAAKAPSPSIFAPRPLVDNGSKGANDAHSHSKKEKCSERAVSKDIPIVTAKQVPPPVTEGHIDTTSSSKSPTPRLSKCDRSQEKRHVPKRRCKAFREGRCHNDQCPKRHPPSWDPKLAKDNPDDASDTDHEEAAVSVKEVSKHPPSSQVQATALAAPSRASNATEKPSSAPAQSSVASGTPRSTAFSHAKPTSAPQCEAAILKTNPVSQADSSTDRRPICRDYLKGFCKNHHCPRQHVNPSRAREVAAQSEQHRQQSPAVDAVVSVTTKPPLSVPSSSGKSAAPNKANSETPSAAPSPPSSHKPSKGATQPTPNAEVESRAAEEPKGIGDLPTRGLAVCQFFQAGQCIAASCKLLHELPKSAPVKPPSHVEMQPSSKNNGTTTSSPSQAKADPLKARNIVEPSPLDHPPFSNVADLGIEETTLPAGTTNGHPPKPSGLPPKPEPPQDSQHVRGWVPDPRPARRYNETCRQYRWGHCPRGENCPFTHTLAIDNRRARSEWEVCRWYLIGACDYGNICYRMHISPDSPTLVLPTQRSDSALPASPVRQEHAGAGVTKTIQPEKRCDATIEKPEPVKPVLGTERVIQETNIRSVETPVGASPIDKGPEPEVTPCDLPSTYLHSARDGTITVDDRPARRSSVVCPAYLGGQCRHGDECYERHIYSQPGSVRATLPRETEMPSLSPLRPDIDASAAQVPTPTLGQRIICLNWLVRGTCLNGAGCAYEHSARGLLSLAQHATRLPDNVAPIPADGMNNSEYQPHNFHPNTSGLREQALDRQTLYHAPFSPRSPLATSQLGPLMTQAEAVDCLLNLSNSPASRQQTFSPDRQSDRTSAVPSSSWREPVMRGARRTANTRYDDPSRHHTPGNLADTTSSVGPRLWQSPPDPFRRAEQPQDIRDAVATDRGEDSTDSSFHSAVDFFDASNNTSPSTSTATSVDSPPAKAKSEKPVCWDFLHGRCRRWVCYFRHEYPPEQQSANATPSPKSEADTQSSVKSPSRSADTLRPRTTGLPERVRQEQQPGNARHPTLSAQPATIPSVPPGLGLEPLPSLVSPPTVPRREPPANMTLTVLDSTRVTYGPGFGVQSIVTAFETRQVMLKDLPRGISNWDVSDALKSYGEVNSVFLPDPGKRGVAGAKVTFATPEQAANAASALDGTELFGSTISARLWSGQTSLVGKARLVDGDVLFEFPCAHKTGYAGYPTRAQAEKAISLANETEVKGNWITAELHEGLPSAGAVTVRFRGLPASTQMKDLARYGKAEGFMMERPNYESTKIAIHRLRGILEKFGHDFLFNLLPPPYKRGNVRAYAHFETAEAAETVCAALNNRRQPFCGYGLLSATHVSTLVYQLPRPVFDALAYDIRLLNAFVWKTFEPGSSISIIDNRAARGPYSPVCVKLAARRSQALTKMKALFDRLLHGERIEQDGEIVWDTFFARRAGAMYLEDLQKRHAGILINRDPRKGILSLFGPEPKRRIVRSAILAKVGDLKSRKWYTIDLPGRLIGLFCGWDLATLQLRFGEENVMLDIAARILRVRGDDAVHEAALLAVKQARERHADEKHQPQVECPVCFTEVTNPVKLDCGHTWCKNCLQNYLRASIDNASFPLVCLGDEASCSARIPIHVAQEVLSTNDFNDILEAAFRAHVHSHPKEYHYCPTPDCKQVYHRNTKCHVLQCPSCLLRICPKCNAEYHEHSPCQGDEASDRALFEEWKQSHDVKDCPGCKAPIERDAGCNHMTCVRCKTHICWVCLATFEESGEVYAHMHSIHGGIGLEEV